MGGQQNNSTGSGYLRPAIVVRVQLPAASLAEIRRENRVHALGGRKTRVYSPPRPGWSNQSQQSNGRHGSARFD